VCHGYGTTLCEDGLESARAVMGVAASRQGQREARRELPVAVGGVFPGG